MKLTQMLPALETQAITHPDLGDLEIRGVYNRAQEVEPGGLFVAVRGFAADGHDYIDQAVSRGAAVVVCERLTGIEIPQIRVTDSRRALALLAAEFYGHPSRHMTVVGITGTNGKTTISYLIESMLAAAGRQAGVIGTVNYRYGGRCFDNPVTTPESLDLQRIMAAMRAAGITHVIMEVSSHALDLCRIEACDVDVAIFTNLTQDHLDFHLDMESYWASKSKLFEQVLPACAGKTAVRAVINADDPRGAQLAAALALPHLSTGHGKQADVHAVRADFSLHGISADIHTPTGTLAVRSALVGRHNLENILNAVGAGVALGLTAEEMLAGIAALDNVPGRLERVPDPGGRLFVYVDYAHTPDALHNALAALRDLAGERLICVFGCGGDRDRTKRPLMGAVAARLSDLAVVTSDNPRTEPPGLIIDQILAGVPPTGLRHYEPASLSSAFDEKGFTVEPDRRKAIMLAVQTSRPGDTILIAGKGHETYQIIGKSKTAFDDRIIAAEAISSLNRDKTGTEG
jgi:UDP-N-acetylmuramoyl-L-alanyl-D-glutamate--2,6-diaminopimelate ligase